jgi:hypothetical protein
VRVYQKLINNEHHDDQRDIDFLTGLVRLLAGSRHFELQEFKEKGPANEAPP